MPLYEYECKQCHKRLEKIQHFNSPPEKVCPHCGGALKRVISAPAFQFKGAGWYVTDYAKSGGKAEAAHDGDGKSNGKPEGKTDSPNGGTDKTAGTATPAGSSSQPASAPSSSTSESSGSTVSVANSSNSNP